MTRIALFPARGGSQRIPRKNIRDFKGQPMLTYPINAARDSQLFDAYVVSTDDVEIAQLARWNGCDVHMRPTDDGAVGTNELAARVLRWLGAADEDMVCVIYPCSPMLWAEDLVVSHEMAARQPDRFTYSVLPGGADAGSFYWALAERFLKRVPMGKHDQRVHVDRRRFIDINTPEDWAKAEAMWDALNPTA